MAQIILMSILMVICIMLFLVATELTSLRKTMKDDLEYFMNRYDQTILKLIDFQKEYEKSVQQNLRSENLNHCNEG